MGVEWMELWAPGDPPLMECLTLVTGLLHWRRRLLRNCLVAWRHASVFNDQENLSLAVASAFPAKAKSNAGLGFAIATPRGSDGPNLGNERSSFSDARCQCHPRQASLQPEGGYDALARSRECLDQSSDAHDSDASKPAVSSHRHQHEFPERDTREPPAPAGAHGSHASEAATAKARHAVQSLLHGVINDKNTSVCYPPMPAVEVVATSASPGNVTVGQLSSPVLTRGERRTCADDPAGTTPWTPLRSANRRDPELPAHGSFPAATDTCTSGDMQIVAPPLSPDSCSLSPESLPLATVPAGAGAIVPIPLLPPPPLIPSRAMLLGSLRRWRVAVTASSFERHVVRAAQRSALRLAVRAWWQGVQLARLDNVHKAVAARGRTRWLYRTAMRSLRMWVLATGQGRGTARFGSGSDVGRSWPYMDRASRKQLARLWQSTRVLRRALSALAHLCRTEAARRRFALASAARSHTRRLLCCWQFVAAWLRLRAQVRQHAEWLGSGVLLRRLFHRLRDVCQQERRYREVEHQVWALHAGHTRRAVLAAWRDRCRDLGEHRCAAVATQRSRRDVRVAQRVLRGWREAAHELLAVRFWSQGVLSRSLRALACHADRSAARREQEGIAWDHHRQHIAAKCFRWWDAWTHRKVDKLELYEFATSLYYHPQLLRRCLKGWARAALRGRRRGLLQEAAELMAEGQRGALAAACFATWKFATITRPRWAVPFRRLCFARSVSLALKM
eukprot:jgi/Mesvir1/9720/Mv12191-RA.2